MNSIEWNKILYFIEREQPILYIPELYNKSLYHCFIHTKLSRYDIAYVPQRENINNSNSYSKPSLYLPGINTDECIYFNISSKSPLYSLMKSCKNIYEFSDKLQLYKSLNLHIKFFYPDYTKSNKMKSNKRKHTKKTKIKKNKQIKKKTLKKRNKATINKRNYKCKGKRDGVSGCTDCCYKHHKKNYNKCIHMCMNE